MDDALRRHGMNLNLLFARARRHLFAWFKHILFKNYNAFTNKHDIYIESINLFSSSPNTHIQIV